MSLEPMLFQTNIGTELQQAKVETKSSSDESHQRIKKGDMVDGELPHHMTVPTLASFPHAMEASLEDDEYEDPEDLKEEEDLEEFSIDD
ncbi:hypothetical protein FNV43_RR16815 [Rhamnella rubrinervis]|uniref:Uncharacterized protein n=1 Tax=Rhamnella rubrinervis TaxID=2594499 RepID=A0A8K0MDR7_9ROSA|nr:hypothetical protein FNV43_RR16815 [Rhamnella rubrinervis]